MAVPTVLLAVVHSGIVRYHEWSGARLHERVEHAPAAAADGTDPLAAGAIDRLEFADRWGLVHTIPTRSRLAGLYSRAGRWAEAAPLTAWLVEREPHTAGWHLAHARSLNGLGLIREAEAELRTALGLDPGDADVHHALASLCFRGQRGEEALQHLGDATRLRPDFLEAHADLGTLLLERGDLAGGTQHLQRAVELRPDFADAHYNLAVAHAMAGDEAGARQAIERAYALQPGDARTAALRARLRAPAAAP